MASIYAPVTGVALIFLLASSCSLVQAQENVTVVRIGYLGSFPEGDDIADYQNETQQDTLSSYDIYKLVTTQSALTRVRDQTEDAAEDNLSALVAFSMAIQEADDSLRDANISLEAVICDTNGRPLLSLDCMTQLQAEDNYIATVGANRGQGVSVAALSSTLSRIPYVSTRSIDVALSNKDDLDYLFRTQYLDETNALAHLVNVTGVTNVGVFGIGLNSIDRIIAFEVTAYTLGVNVREHAYSLGPGTTSDSLFRRSIRDGLKRFIVTGIKAIVLIVDQAEWFGEIFPIIDSLGMFSSKQYAFYGDPVLKEYLSSTATNVDYLSNGGIFYLANKVYIPETLAKDYVAAFEEAAAPYNAQLTTLANITYDSTMVVVDALRKLVDEGSDYLNTTLLRQELLSTNYIGITGRIEFDIVQDRISNYFFMNPYIPNPLRRHMLQTPIFTIKGIGSRAIGSYDMQKDGIPDVVLTRPPIFAGGATTFNDGSQVDPFTSVLVTIEDRMYVGEDSSFCLITRDSFSDCLEYSPEVAEHIEAFIFPEYASSGVTLSAGRGGCNATFVCPVVGNYTISTPIDGNLAILIGEIDNTTIQGSPAEIEILQTTQSGSGSSGLSTGVIAVIVVVSILALVLVSLLVAFVIYRTTRNGPAPLPELGQHGAILITDIESSTAMWETCHSAMAEIIVTHNKIIRSLLPRHNGFEVATEGDSFTAIFHSAANALAFCIEMQLELNSCKWPEAEKFKVQKSAENLCPNDTAFKSYQDVRGQDDYTFHGPRVRVGIASGLLTINNSSATSKFHLSKRYGTIRSFDSLHSEPDSDVDGSIDGALTPREKLLLTDVCHISKCIGDAVPSGGQIVMPLSSYIEARDGWSARYCKHQKRRASKVSKSDELSEEVYLESLGEAILEGLDSSMINNDASAPDYEEEHTFNVSENDAIELVSVLPASLCHRSEYFKDIKTKKQVSPAFKNAPGSGRPPFPPVTLVFIYVEGLKNVHAGDDSEVPDNDLAVQILQLLRPTLQFLLKETNGYECEKTADGSLCSFFNPRDALIFAQRLQNESMYIDWPEEVTSTSWGSESYVASKRKTYQRISPREQSFFGSKIMRSRPSSLELLEETAPLSSSTGLQEWNEGSVLVFRGPRLKIGIYSGKPSLVVPHAANGRAS